MIFKLILPFLMTFPIGFFPMDDELKIEDLGLKIEQGEKEIVINKSRQKVLLNKEKFTLVFNLERDDEEAEHFYAARLIADIDPEFFDQFEAGKSIEEIPSLAIGTSMAGPKDAPYECIFFHDQAHHYIFYNSEEENRAHLISQENDLLQLSFDIENYCLQDLEVNIKNSNFDKIYLVFFVDHNLNEILEEDEFVKLEIEFEDINSN